MSLDSRVNPYRDDLADEKLRRRVAAKHYTSGMDGHITVPVTGMRKTPDNNSSLVSQALFGDAVKIFEQKDGWCWIQLQKDNYVGYVPQRNITEGFIEATHRVCVPASFKYPKADLKTQPAKRLFLNSRICVKSVGDKWCELADGSFVYKSHLALIDEFDNDPAAIAEQFIATPYLWGGNTYCGIDCSGLVQQAFHACGLRVPRDSDMIEADFGEAVADGTSLQRNDLVFWDGHVGIMADAETLIHCNGFHMATVREAFAAARDRISSEYNSLPRIRRNMH